MADPQGTHEPRGSSYDLHGEIASGGMATVHLGRLVGARGFARTVAIKVLHKSYAKNKDFVSRFVDEARLVGRIHHPNVMPTLDVIADGDDLRIVMEYVAGESLDQLQAKVRAQGTRIPVRVACAIITGVLHGLHAAHAAKNEFGEPLGIVHLDVSPQNILVGVDGATRVLDFGVARAQGEKPDAAMSGKSAYLAPEQVRGAEVTPRTDVFAASIVLWEMLTGESLFAADNHAATLQRVLGCVVPSILDKVPDLPARLDEVLKQGLKRDPNQRFATARDMALELEQSVVPALPSEVGTWVETVAAVTLVARAAKVRAMESMPVAARAPAVIPHEKLPELVSPRALYDEQAAANLELPGTDPRAASLLNPPNRPELVPQREVDGSIRWQLPIRSGGVAPTMPSPVVPNLPVAGPPAVAPAPSYVAPPQPTRAAPAGRVVTMPMNIPSLAAAPAVDKPARSNRRTLIIVGLVTTLLALVLLTFGARAIFLPVYVRDAAIEQAASHGVSLTVTDAVLSDDGVLLRGLTAKLSGVSGVAISMADADVRVAWSAPTKVVVGKTEVAVDGDVRSILTSVAAWTAGQHGKKAAEGELPGGQVEVPAAHLVWTHPSAGEISRIELSGLSGALGSPGSASIADEGHFLAASLVIESRVGTFGPWNLDVEDNAKGTRARFAFDPSVPDGPNALLVADPIGGTSFDVTIPRVPFTSLGIPRGIAGSEVSLPQQIELALHYGRVGRDQVTSSLRGVLYAVRVPELGNAVDVHVSGEAAGPVNGAMNLKNASFTLGPIHAAVTGTLTPRPSGFGVNLAWKGEPIACSTLVGLPTPGGAARDVARRAADGDLSNLGELARDFGVVAVLVDAVKITGNFTASGTVVAESSDLSHAKIATTAKNSCGIALFQGK